MPDLIVAEPVHSLGYLPLYVAIHQGFFTAEHLAPRPQAAQQLAEHRLSGQP